MTTYAEFLSNKRAMAPHQGITINPSTLHPSLKPHQRDLVTWTAGIGQAAGFAAAGLGKTRCYVEVSRAIGRRSLVLAPLAVCSETVREAASIDVEVVYARNQAESPSTGITITNYERLGHFNPDDFDVVHLDESSILKDEAAKTRTTLIEAFRHTPYRFCWTATPAPNDVAELANHAEFLGVATREEMLATYFVHAPKKGPDGKPISGEKQAVWRLRGHATQAFYRWLASWAMSISRPSDLGYPDDGYILPPLSIGLDRVPTDYVPPGQLFATGLDGITGRAAVRRDTVTERVAAAARLIAAEPDQQWIAWVGLNDEGRALAKLVPDAC